MVEDYLLDTIGARYDLVEGGSELSLGLSQLDVFAVVKGLDLSADNFFGSTGSFSNTIDTVAEPVIGLSELIGGHKISVGLLLGEGKVLEVVSIVLLDKLGSVGGESESQSGKNGDFHFKVYKLIRLIRYRLSKSGKLCFKSILYYFKSY